MDKGHYNGVILFDTVDHGILKEKLKNYGIQNTELAWFGPYLNIRMQAILLFKRDVIGNSRSSLWYTPGIVSGTTAVSDIYQ